MSLIHCMLLPLKGYNILVPSVTIAEILPFKDLEQTKEAPLSSRETWAWRGENLPFVRLEKELFQKESAVQARSCVAVMNVIDGHPKHHFLGILLQSYPRIYRVMENSLKVISTQEKPFPGFFVKVADLEEAWLFDMGKVQTSILQSQEK